jgi:hypothetical protein
MYIDMKRILKNILKFQSLVWTFVILNSGSVLAQCAMCKASVETNVNVDGIGFAAKLNSGILYLFVMPYLLAMVIGILWYKKSREQRRKELEALERKQRIAGL